MKQLKTWDNYDRSPNSVENSLIMSDLSEEMAKWVEEGDEIDARRLMDTIERYFHEGDLPLTSIIYTDFLVTIMEAKRETRELIKTMMGSETKKNYFKLFNFYRESDS
ncbi:hypothetical protein ESA94_19915 [Lacibacter luteus]|uniref:DUF7674 domain-containing protein n=1 Tax=Lacibacter luteus TaxID=2508719 RepID=A0A4Q1CE13_9BACT|nr:hypothetical protein [Lacibacter luteus]RXK57788.1 hypothetical protein ESA94_19915 [Lacibacter luteus]